LSLLRPRSVLLAVTEMGEADETLELARAARSRGGVVLALTAHAEGPLAQMADGVFLFDSGRRRGWASSRSW
jgi:DNA-binding MurR/RpiR family transcriptional regulator